MDTKTQIKNLFGQKIQITVPTYQRAYSWTVGKDGNIGQVDQFLEDLKGHDSNKDYYLGHFLFEKDTTCEYGYYVIDGQQRLTTIVIFMSCLIQELKNRKRNSIADETLEEISEFYLVHHKRQKFVTVVPDSLFFEQNFISFEQNYIVNSNRKSIKLLQEARDFFVTNFANAENDELDDWYKILSNAIITTFVMEGNDAKLLATQIFAFQNDRGKELTRLEKLKAYCMHQMYRYAEVEEVRIKIKSLEDYFSHIFSNIEDLKTSEDQILNWHCQAFTSKQSEAFSSIKDDFASANNKKEWLLNFVGGLDKTYRLMRKFEALEHGNGNRIVADICFLDKANATPLILKLLHYDENLEKSISILEAIEKILFKITFTVGNYRTNKLITFAKEYDGNNDSLMSKLNDVINSGFNYWWDFNGWCRQYFESNTYHYRREIKYILYKYENFLRKKAAIAELSVDECSNIFREKRLENTLDHITPQEPDFISYTNEFKSQSVNDIGNLTLLTWSNNASKNNHNPALPDIREKYNTVYMAQKEIYKILCRTGKWGKEEIAERKAKILEFIVKQWGI